MKEAKRITAECTVQLKKVMKVIFASRFLAAVLLLNAGFAIDEAIRNRPGQALLSVTSVIFMYFTGLIIVEREELQAAYAERMARVDTLHAQVMGLREKWEGLIRNRPAVKSNLLN